ncbi:hypothetical protein AGMMS49983_01430 [Clostridia bacterium]|nr:hypothetical protein AGMMS49983_01430 [Clostridia bacterium]
MSKPEQLMEYIVRDVIEYYVAIEKIDMKTAMVQFYNSEMFGKLHDAETGLYLCSSAYVYDLFRDEIQNGKIVQLEI